MNRTLNTTPATQPVDIDTMRHSISQLLGRDAPPPARDELPVSDSLLRGHLQLIIPEVERAAHARDEDDVPRYCALACVGEARGKLRATAAQGEHGALTHARKLARTLAALCDHYEALTDAVMCLACDQPLRDDEETLPYGLVRPSDSATRAGSLHTRCAHAVRRH
ncbi:DUF6415 family natural product biosynthesis protein [Streptomyces cyaneochromogenes]|uniref:DUF6415 family natural product biosynthesis protein n=1 Tax=Streptomyces cyaneochromogenes TaxID=2496836 RepID=UPI00158AF997|nr:DUF6415 family natural product biosynthesis protein [Streptomyces cyaneochromogenes]